MFCTPTPLLGRSTRPLRRQRHQPPTTSGPTPINHPSPATTPAASSGRLVLLAFASLLPLAPAVDAQRVVMGGHGAPESFVLREVAAVLVPDPDGDAARIVHVMAGPERVAAYREVDLREGDRVIAANGKRVRTAKEVEEVYAGIAVGANVELGIERTASSGGNATTANAAGSKERKIVRFAKADPAALPAPQMRMVMVQGGEGGEAGQMEVLPALGAVLRQAEEKGSPIEVAAVLPNGDGRLAEGDHITSLNGEVMTDLARFQEVFVGIEIGAQVELRVNRGGKAETLRFAKQAPPPGRRVVVQ